MSRADPLDPVFRALADPRRRRILDLLRDGALTTGELCEAFDDLDRCTVMQHLAVLEEADLLIVQRIGRQRWNHLNPLPIQAVADRWISRYAAPQVRKLAAFKEAMEALAELR